MKRIGTLSIKLLNINDLDAGESVPRTIETPNLNEAEAPSAPAITQVDPERVKELFPAEKITSPPQPTPDLENDKKNWL